MPRDFLVLATLVCFAPACAVGASLTGPGAYAVNTPDYYTEHKVLFAGEPPDAVATERKPLLHAHQLRGGGSAPIEPLSPLGVIVRGVRLPEDLQTRRDVAVILDVVTAGDAGATSLVVFYQRDVPGGQMLNFQDLLVYYDPEWDGVTPPYFRVRVLEVNSERNTATRQALESAGSLASGLGGSVPHSIIPAVQTAIEAAKLVLGNRRNKVIIDYQVQFYSVEQVAGSGGAPLGVLRQGEWLVIGRPRGAGSDFWATRIELDLRTGVLMAAAPPGTAGAHPEGAIVPARIDAPYVSLVLSTADAVVPKLIMDRSQALVELLSSPTERSNYDALWAAARDLGGAVQAYTLERRLRRYRSADDFRAVVNAIKAYNSQVKTGATPDLQVGHIRTLVRIVNEFAGEPSFGGPQDVENWWNQDQVASGSMIQDKRAKHGWRWTWQGAP